MISLTVRQKTFVRYVISINMSVAFGLFAGLINSQARSFFGYLPLPVFLIATALGLAWTAAYASLIGPMLFDVWAILGGWAAGALSALLLARVEIVPYSLLLPLLITALITTILTFVVPRPKPFKGLDRVVMIIHLISIGIVVWGIIYSLRADWIRPLGLLLALDVFALWSPALVGGCPLTFVESDLRVATGQQTELGRSGFIRYYSQKWFGVKLARNTSKNAARIIAIALFSWWTIDYLIRK